MKRTLSVILAAFLVAGSCGAVMMHPTTVQAKQTDKKAKKNGLQQGLGQLKWGMSMEEAKKHIAEKIMDDYRIKTEGNSDLKFVDNALKLHNERVETMQKSQLTLTRENSSGLSVSIVGEEFMPDTGESVLTSRDDHATRYYFFKDDQLYKIAIVYDASYIGPIAFDTFCATTAQKYGPATSEVWDDDGNFNESIWTEKGSDVKLTVKNKYSTYNTFLMVYSNDAVESKLQKAHRDYHASLSAGPEVSSAIDALTADSTEDAGSSVDALLGKKTKVDLLAGLSQDDIDIINGKTTEAEIEKKKKAKAKKAESSRKKDAKAKQGLEIY